MNKRILILPAALLMISSAIFAAAQTVTTVTPTPITVVTKTPATVTKTVQKNPDGSYTIIEYPVGKEVQLSLTPVSLTGAKAVGTILRDDSGTRVVLNMTDVPADVSAINVYAVDDAGVVTLLGPVTLANGAGKFTATTPLSKFMLIAAPEAGLTSYDPTAKIYFRSAVPEGFAVIPMTSSPVGETVGATAVPVTTAAATTLTTVPATTVTTVPATAVPETTVALTTVPTTAVPATTVAVTTVPTTTVTTVPATTVTTVPATAVPETTVALTTTAVTTTPNTVPMLNIPAYKKGDDTKLQVEFTGVMSGARANIFIEPHKNKPTAVKLVFHELKEAPTGQSYLLWAVSPDNQFFKLGQIVNYKGRNEAEIKATTTLPDFGLLVTMEDLAAVKTVVTPVGPRLGVIQLIP
jgi:hypothetical protein